MMYVVMYSNKNMVNSKTLILKKFLKLKYPVLVLSF